MKRFHALLQQGPRGLVVGRYGLEHVVVEGEAVWGREGVPRGEEAVEQRLVRIRADRRGVLEELRVDLGVGMHEEHARVEPERPAAASDEQPCARA
eukprot:3941333-Rhodomonas_salina.1